ncbi:MAG: TIGR00268 family protein [Firmicutes bacterium HGW-Firmicutes-13]|nr:MAG: TIGR00268 family protein [Firmicutes bacterium HGW-Firmicutes-13]
MKNDDLTSKLEKLKNNISEMKKVTVAFSGGTDSTLLLKVCLEVLGHSRVRAFMAYSPLIPQEELAEAKKLAGLLKVRLQVIDDLPDLNSPVFKTNPPDRCYYCKKEIYSVFTDVGFNNAASSASSDPFDPSNNSSPYTTLMMEGTNIDDLADYRPGRKAAVELGVKAPFVETGFTKEDIRNVSRELELPNWNKPAQACLASRIPYGKTVSTQKLIQIEEGEKFLKKIGFEECRVRHYGSLTRLEVPSKMLDMLLKKSPQICSKFKTLGFTYITLDMMGLRKGSLNEESIFLE